MRLHNSVSVPGLHAVLSLLSDSSDPTVVATPESWALIRRASGPFGVRGLVAYAARPFLPSAERAWCDQVLTTHWHRYEQRMRHLEAVLNVMGKACIRPLVLKGPLLARRHYSPPFLRKPSSDLDLAIRPADFDRACDTLLRAGYSLGQSLAEAKSCSHHLLLLHPSMPRIELHFRLSHGTLGIPVEEFFERAVAENLPHVGQAWVFSESDEILHLLLHYAQHRFPLLFHVHEIRRIWQKVAPETRTEVLLQAQKHRFLSVLVMIDIAFRAIWGEPFFPAGLRLPKTWLHKTLNEHKFQECVSWSQPGYELTLAHRLKGRWLDFQLTDTPSDALKFLGMIAHVTWYRLRKQGWKTLEFPHFAAPVMPDQSDSGDKTSFP